MNFLQKLIEDMRFSQLSYSKRPAEAQKIIIGILIHKIYMYITASFKEKSKRQCRSEIYLSLRVIFSDIIIWYASYCKNLFVFL